MINITAKSAPEAYYEGLYIMKAFGQEEPSRLGRVKVMPEPTLLTLENPRQRVIFNRQRNCNPFFHVMEFVWMMTGSRDVLWISKFNKQMLEYANSLKVHGAYGYRWRKHSGDQIARVIKLLQNEPETRRAVLAMWDASCDLNEGFADYPCNTHIYFRNAGGKLDMTVCNRSNDLIWGMFGANIVHMTYLHELIAHCSELGLGKYRVFTNNLHIYEQHWPLMDVIAAPYENLQQGQVESHPLLQGDESYEELINDCKMLVNAEEDIAFDTRWVQYVAYPMLRAYMERLNRKGDGLQWISLIEADDWKLNCQEWVAAKSGQQEESTTT
jgi:thymidylate synthase